MGERHWQQVEWSDGSPPVVTPVGPSMTREEVLAEMDTEALVEELQRRGFQPITDEASFVEWLRSMKEVG